MERAGLQLKDIMTRDVRTVGRNDQLAVADTIMKQARIRHLPVLDADGGVCAVVSQRDLFRGALLRALGFGGRAEDAMLRQVAVKEIMSDELHTATPDMTVSDAASIMIERKIGCLPVVESGRLVGLVTETDFVRLVADGASSTGSHSQRSA
ncbi:MAG: CBS domain-containing protein [Vicinamibacteria bacterium]|nr:CBS domain-containing protein [Vicinamibacteria bacterium]